MKKRNIKRSQVISLDLIMGIAIFIIVLSMFFVFFSSKLDNVPEAEVKREAVVFKNLVSVNNPEEETAVTLIVQNQLDYKKLADLAASIYTDKKSYEEIKAQLDIKSDFCIFFEDSEGKILPIILPSEDDTVKLIYGVGNPELDFKLNDTIVCGKVYEINEYGQLVDSS